MSNRLCRLCLEHSSKLVDIFDCTYKEMNFQLKIRQILSVLIQPSDLMKYICLECVDHVTDFHRYWVHVKQSQAKIAYRDTRKESYVLDPMNSIKVECNEEEEENKISVLQNNDLNSYIDKFNNEDVLKKQLQLSTENITCKNSELPVEFIPCDPSNSRLEAEEQNIDNFDIEHSPCRGDTSDFEDIPPINDSISSNPAPGNSNLTECDTLTEPIYDLSKFPTELMKDGKMILKTSEMHNLLRQFYNLQCPLCNIQKFGKAHLLLAHMKTAHKTRGYVTCYCNTRLYTQKSVTYHMAKHLQPSAFECPICKRTVTQPLTLRSHIQTHLPQDEKPYKCDECDLGFSYRDNLKVHKESFHVPDEDRKTFKCEICGKEYKVNASLYLHVQRHHPAPNSASILCTDCGKTFLTKTLFKIHMLVHHDTTGKNKVQCKHCDVVCKNQLSMKAHEKLHSGVRVSCHLCSYTTHQKKFLTNHMRVKHTDAKPFSCSICHKSFKRKSCLRAHLAQHTGEAKCSCTFCPRTFVSSGNCSSHRKRMHPEECKNEKRRILNEKLKGIEIPPDPEEVESEDIHQLAREIVSKMNKLIVFIFLSDNYHQNKFINHLIIIIN